MSICHNKQLEACFSLSSTSHSISGDTLAQASVMPYRISNDVDFLFYIHNTDEKGSIGARNPDPDTGHDIPSGSILIPVFWPGLIISETLKFYLLMYRKN